MDGGALHLHDHGCRGAWCPYAESRGGRYPVLQFGTVWTAPLTELASSPFTYSYRAGHPYAVGEAHPWMPFALDIEAPLPPHLSSGVGSEESDLLLIQGVRELRSSHGQPTAFEVRAVDGSGRPVVTEVREGMGFGGVLPGRWYHRQGSALRFVHPVPLACCAIGWPQAWCVCTDQTSGSLTGLYDGVTLKCPRTLSGKQLSWRAGVAWPAGLSALVRFDSVSWSDNSPQLSPWSRVQPVRSTPCAVAAAPSARRAFASEPTLEMRVLSLQSIALDNSAGGGKAILRGDDGARCIRCIVSPLSLLLSRVEPPTRRVLLGAAPFEWERTKTLDNPELHDSVLALRRAVVGMCIPLSRNPEPAPSFTRDPVSLSAQSMLDLLDVLRRGALLLPR